MPGKRGTDMVGASALACSGDFLLRLAGCQREDLVAEVRRTALAASGFSGSARRFLPRDLRKIIRHRKLRFATLYVDHGNSFMVMRICRISSRSFRRSAGASGV